MKGQEQQRPPPQQQLPQQQPLQHKQPQQPRQPHKLSNAPAHHVHPQSQPFSFSPPSSNPSIN